MRRVNNRCKESGGKIGIGNNEGYYWMGNGYEIIARERIIAV